MKPVLIAALALAVVSCSTPQTTKKASLFSETPIGSTLVIKKPLTVPAGSQYALLQSGQQIKRAEVDKWEPYCQLIVGTVQENGKVIPAGMLRITRVVKEEKPFTRLKRSGRKMVATTGDDLALLYAATSYSWLYKTNMHLDSGKQTGAYQLVCGQVWDGHTARRLHVWEFEQAVGDYLSIKPAGRE
jgi:hypothetical protein